MAVALPLLCAIGYRVSLHAGVFKPATDRERLERVCRYTGRPPLAMERLGWLEDGRVSPATPLARQVATRDGVHGLRGHQVGAGFHNAAYRLQFLEAGLIWIRSARRRSEHLRPMRAASGNPGSFREAPGTGLLDRESLQLHGYACRCDDRPDALATVRSPFAARECDRPRRAVGVDDRIARRHGGGGSGTLSAILEEKLSGAFSADDLALREAVGNA